MESYFAPAVSWIPVEETSAGKDARLTPNCETKDEPRSVSLGRYRQSVCAGRQRRACQIVSARPLQTCLGSGWRKGLRVRSARTDRDGSGSCFLCKIPQQTLAAVGSGLSVTGVSRGPLSADRI